MRTLGHTPEDYLSSLLPEREDALRVVRNVIVSALPAGYVECLRATAIYYEVPRSAWPDWHRGRPLIYAGLASQKNHMSVYLRPLYTDWDMKELFVARWQAGGTPLRMGKGCVRFRSLAEIDLELVADTIAAYSVAEFLALQATRRRP